MRNKFLIASICALSLSAAGCIKETGQNPDQTLTGSDYFDFNSAKSISLSVDYCFPNKDYTVLFEVYAQNPTVENTNNELVKLDIEPIYRAATDGAGRMNTKIQVPAHLSKVWLYSEYPGTLSPIEIEIKADQITFNQNAYMAQVRKNNTRGTTPNAHTYPEGWLALGDWDQYGTPDNLDAQRTMPSANTLYNINEVFLKYTPEKLKTRYPQFFAPSYSSDLKVIKPTKIYLSFINSSAAWKNTVGYYTYPTGQTPESVADIKRIIAFPNALPFIRKTGETIIRGALAGGDRVQLKYWDGTQFHEEFPAGVTIGWWLEGMGFNLNGGNIVVQNGGKFSRFSTDNLNADKERRAVALRDSKTERIVAISFEDNIDMRYNDATFYLEIAQDGAIDSNIPVLPSDNDGPTDQQNYVHTQGFLMFEDLWPYTGDYDMNDVMIKYSSKVYKHVLNNSVYRVETEYLSCHNGGKLQSGFGVHFPGLSPEMVHKVTIEGTAPSSYMQGQMLEPGQSSATLILHDNITSAINKPITVTIDLNDAPETQFVPPFNPFIFTDADKSRGKEVHLVKHVPTTRPIRHSSAPEKMVPTPKHRYIM